jgi:hypothetical protein
MQRKSIQYKIGLNSKKVLHDFGSFTAISASFEFVLRKLKTDKSAENVQLPEKRNLIPD